MFGRALLANNNGEAVMAVMAVLSSGLHVSNFLQFAIAGREIIFVQRTLVRGGGGGISVCQMGEVCIFVTFAQFITFESIIL